MVRPRPGALAGFRCRYAEKLRSHRASLALLRRLARAGTVTLVHAARDERHIHAVVLRAALLGRAPRRAAGREVA